MISPTTPKRRAIRFAPKIRVRLIPHFNDYSREEVESVWFTDDECERIELEIRDAVITLQISAALGESDDDDDQQMGLESHCRDGAYEEHVSLVKAGVEAVLREQERQRRHGGPRDEEAIAKLYHEATAAARVAARVRGVRYLDSNLDGNESFEVSTEINQMAVAASASSSFKNSERRGIARSLGQRRLQDVPLGMLSHDFLRPKGAGSNVRTSRPISSQPDVLRSTAATSQESSLGAVTNDSPCMLSFEKSNKEERKELHGKGCDNRKDAAVTSLRFVKARIALSGRCALPSKTNKSYTMLSA